jgi:YhcH/YjgK/YiaL family protein
MILGNIFHKSGCITQSVELNKLIHNLQIPRLADWSFLITKGRDEGVNQILVSINEHLDRIAESHLVNADLHFLVEGSEIHRFWNTLDNLGIKDQHIEDDNIFYPSIDDQKSNLIQLFPGDFIVYWPGEIHIAGIGNTQAKKIIYKIKV